MFVYAHNRIQRPNADGGAEPEVIPARTVFESTMEKFKELEGLGAARKATTEEIDVYRAQKARAQGTTVVAADDSVATAEADRLAAEGSNGGSAADNTGGDAADAGNTGNSTTTPAKGAGGKGSAKTAGKSGDDLGVD